MEGVTPLQPYVGLYALDGLSNKIDMTGSKKAILVASFGTSYNDNRAKTIDALEKEIAEKYPDWEVRRAFTSRMIIRKLKERDNLHIDYVTEAMDRLSSEGFDTVVVQPTHVMNGMEYDDVVRIVSEHVGNIPNLTMGKPLLTTSEDYDEVVEALEKTLIPLTDNETALVLMGHGSEHYANATYSQLQIKLWGAGHDNVYVTTVEGYPEFDDTLAFMEGKGYRKAVVFPLMLVAGDHANNDMAGDDDDSLKSVLEDAGYEVRCIVKGMGECPEFRNLFLDHIDVAVEKACKDRETD